MPDIKSVIRQMIADGESEDVIDAVVKKMQGGSEIKSGLPDMSPATPDKDEYKGPDTWMGGFKKSLFQKAPGSQFSEAMQAGGEGFLGNLESIKDIPANFAYGAKDLLDFHLNPGQTSLRMMESLKQIPDIVKNAGADPRTFGRTLGAFTTAPLVTEGLGVGAIRGPGAINRIPRVNKTLSSIGSTLEGTRHSNYVPTTPRGLVAGAVRGVARPIGRVLSRAGERGRLAGSSVESANDAAARNRPNPPPNEKVYAGGGQGATRNRPVRHDTPDRSTPDRNSAFTRPILETAEELAARKRPSVFTGGQSRRNQSTPFEPRPVDTTPYEAPPTRPEGLPPELPITPTPDPIPVGEGGLSSRYRSRPYEPGQQAAAIAENADKPKAPPAAAPQSTFEPSIDPTKNFSFEDLAMMKSRRDEVNAILHQMADENVDVNTGEIFPFQETFPGLEQPPKRARNWNITRDEGAKFADNVNEEMGFSGPEQTTDFANDVGLPESPRRFPGDEAFDLGEINPGFRQTSSMPDWGSETIPQKKPTNPLRPEVPPGQVTNRRMFELSEQRAAEMKAAEAQQFNDSIAPHEFSEDMMFTPDELRPAEVPPMVSPVENIFDPRTSNIDMTPKSERIYRGGPLEGRTGNSFFTTDPNEAISYASLSDIPEHRLLHEGDITEGMFRDPITTTKGNIPESWADLHRVIPNDQLESAFTNRANPRAVPEQTAKRHAPSYEELLKSEQSRTIQPEEWGDWGGLEADIPTLVPDASGSHVAAPFESIADARTRMGFQPADIPEPAPKPSLFQRTRDLMRDETGAVGPNIRQDAKPRLIKEDGSRVKPVGTKGEGFRVTGPDGKHLGDISITEKQIAEIAKHPNYTDMPREEIVKAIHEARLETILEEAGIAEDAMSRVKVEPLDGRLKRNDPVEAKSQPPMPYPFSKDANDVGNYGAESLTDYSGTSRAPAFPNAKPKVPKVDKVKATTIDPDADFGPGGNIEPIIQEARRLDGDKAVDSKYKSLLPKEMRGEIGPGETYKGKLQTLIKTIQEELGPEQGAQRLAEMDAFNDSLRGYTQEQSNIPPLDPSTIDVSKLRQGKLNRQPQPWISPRMVQQFPDLARKLKAQRK